jgi:hypothetical protein
VRARGWWQSEWAQDGGWEGCDDGERSFDGEIGGDVFDWEVVLSGGRRVIEWNGVNLGRWELASKMKVTVLRFYQGATRKSFNHIPRMVENVLIEDLAILEHESLSFSAARFLGGSVQLWLCRAAHYSSIQNPPVQREQLEKKNGHLRR